MFFQTLDATNQKQSYCCKNVDTRHQFEIRGRKFLKAN